MIILEVCAACAATAKVLNPCFPCLKPIQAECTKNVESFVDLDINLKSLAKVEEKLQKMAATVEMEVESERNQDRDLQTKPQVTWWLDGVREALDKSPLLTDYQGLKRCACCCCCCNVVLSSDCQLHRKAKEKLDEVNQLMEQGDKLERPYTMRLNAQAANWSYRPSIFGMQQLLKRFWSEFGNPIRSVIGIFGPGGVGKTTLLKEFKKQLESNEEYRHAVVIFIEVANSSGTLNVAPMQKQIINQLNYEWDESQGERERAALLLNVLCGKKFVVLLDAVWRSFQLAEVGIPYPDNGSKLIVASRSDNVCTEMQAMSPIEMKGLKKEEAMQLFLSNLKQDLRDAIKENGDLRSNVEDIVRKCGGLPLALNVLGSALACAKYPAVLADAASNMYDHSQLRNFDKMLDTLARSYNELDETTKKCFLYCVLFPDNGSIDIQQLEDYWVAEGLISWSSMSPHAGNLFISNLISASLLQKSDTGPESEVKMHYMIREMGIRLAKQQGYVIEASRGLTEAPAEEWTKATRISLMSNKFDELSISPECPELETLLLQNNPSLCRLGSNLFRRMPQLKVLDLSHTAIDKLPDCGALRQLACFNLSHTNIKEFPRDICNKLGKLLYLNLSHTNIKEFPDGICNKLGKLLYLNMSHTRFTRLPRNLSKLKLLRHLNLSETSALKEIPNGTISRLFALRILNLYKSHYGILELPDLNLDKLEQLRTLGITIHSEPVLGKLRKDRLLAKRTRFLSLSDCQDMQSIEISKFENMQKLEELNIESCNGLQSIDADMGENKASGGSVKVLYLRILSDLHQVVVPAVGHHFRSLRHLAIHACHKLVNVSWVLQLHSLEWLEISECSELEEIVQEQSNGTTSMTSTSGEPLEVINTAAATCTSNSNLHGPDASSSQNDELNEIVQEQSNRAAPRVSIASEIQEEIGDTPGIQGNSEAFASTSMVREERTGTTSLTSDVGVNQQGSAINYRGANIQKTHPFDRLRIIVFKDLIKLKSICTRSLFPRLASIKVRACPNLRKLPVGRMPKLKQIHGENDWWDGLPPEMNAHLSIFTFIA